MKVIQKQKGIARWEVMHQLVATKNYKLGVELGVHEGQTLFFLLENNKNLNMVGIDHWGPRPNMDQELNYKTVRGKAKMYGLRCEIIRSDTADAAPRFPDASVDFVFVDADHSYVGCKKDIDAWLPKIRQGGVMIGHDINLESVHCAVYDSFGNKWLPYPAKMWVWQYL